VRLQQISGVLTMVLLCLVLACEGQQQPGNANTVNIDNEIARLKKQLKVSPKSSSLHEQLAAMLAGKGDWAESDKEMNLAIRLDPHNPVLLIEAAQGYSERSLMPKAIEMLRRAVAIDPKNPLPHFVLGVKYERQSDSTNAMTEYREAQRLIDTLSESTQTPGFRNRIVSDSDHQVWYIDQFDKHYLLNDILGPLKRKLSK
jgi:cytochrome c-type biogenesis protein CcmH/NrfG